MIYLSIATLVLVATQASAKLSPEKHKDDISSAEHYKDGVHDSKYDHDAFLGERLAQEWEKLPPTEVKQRLRGLFPKIDVNKDSKISFKELYEWIEGHMKEHVTQGVDMRLKHMDKNGDGKISWEEYVGVEYDPTAEIGIDKSTLEDLKKMKERDEKRFAFVDTDSDKLLDRQELGLFLHPEESPRMTSMLVQENLEVFDLNNDGLVSLEEFLGAGDEKMDKETIASLTESFRETLDVDGDGVLNKEEVKKWITGVEEDPVKGEARHLIKEADDNSDNHLSEQEIIDHYSLFAGSRATRYGELIKEDL